MNKAKLIKSILNPRRSVEKAAAKARKVRLFLKESTRLYLGLNDYDRGRAEDFLDLGGRDLAAHFRARTCPLWDAEAFAAIRAGIPAAEREALIQAADRTVAHLFDYLGSGPTKIATGEKRDGYENIDWHLDYRHGGSWPARVHHKRIKVVKGDGSDIKYLWELSRLAHLMTLGQAFVLTGDRKYVREYARQVIDWLAANPVDAGANWQCCMEVGIRAANLAMSFFLIQGPEGPGEDFLKVFLPALWRHCHHIVNHLEWSEELTSNHYLSNISGLFVTCSLFPELKGSEKWLAFARIELEKEMVKQVLPDGTNFEASTCYHRLVLELFFYPALLGSKQGKPFSPAYLAMMEKMFQATHAFIRHDGRINQVGDNDSGRYFIFFPDHDSTQQAYMLGLGAEFYCNPTLAFREIPDATESRWVFPHGDLQALTRQSPSMYATAAAAFKDSGWYVFRNADMHFQISCGPNGQGPYGGHAHNDKLSFCLQHLGQDILVDPGTYVYTSDGAARNRFRSTASHNTASVDGREQNPLSPRNHFILPDLAKAKTEKWEVGEDGFHFAGSHSGFAPVIHRREIICEAGTGGTILIRDRFTGLTGPTAIRFFFQLGPQVTARPEGPLLRLKAGPSRTTLRSGAARAVFAIEKSSYSPGYGSARDNLRAVLALTGNEDFTHETIISLELAGSPGALGGEA